MIVPNDKGSADGSFEDSYTNPTMAIREVRDYTQNIIGKMKTLIDAFVSDPKQNKALKDLIHNQVWDAYTEILRWSQEVCDPKKQEETKRIFPFSHGEPILGSNI